MQAGEATLENSMEVPQEVKNRATLGSGNCTIRYYPKDTKITNALNDPEDTRFHQSNTTPWWPRDLMLYFKLTAAGV